MFSSAFNTSSVLQLFAVRDDMDDNIYNYTPSKVLGYLFVSLFSISTIWHIIQTFQYRLWWSLPTMCLAGLTEVLGWSGRLWSAYNPTITTAFQIQIVCTIQGPTPLIAANFVILGRLIHRLGPVYSRLSPRNYSIIFVACDILALTIQGVGGGIASAADDEAGANKGGNIMLGGIVFQLVVLTFYILFASEFLFRYIKDKPIASRVLHKGANYETVASPEYFRGVMSGNQSLLLGALALDAVFLYIRAIYRTVELTDGWTGKIISTEWYFVVFDGAMVVLAIYTLNVLHPGMLLGPESSNLSSGSDEAVKPLKTELVQVPFRDPYDPTYISSPDVVGRR